MLCYVIFSDTVKGLRKHDLDGLRHRVLRACAAHAGAPDIHEFTLPKKTRRDNPDYRPGVPRLARCQVRSVWLPKCSATLPQGGARGFHGVRRSSLYVMHAAALQERLQRWAA